MAKTGSYKWEGKVKIYRSLEKAATVEINEATS
jgi:ribosomal protein S24E